MAYFTEDKDKSIIYIVKKYSDKYNLTNRGGGESVYQCDDLGEAAIDMLADIADVIYDDMEE